MTTTTKQPPRREEPESLAPSSPNVSNQKGGRGLFPGGRWLMDILCKRPADTSHRRHPCRHIWTESFKPCVNLTSCHASITAFITATAAAGPDCRTATHRFVSLIHSGRGSCLSFLLFLVSYRCHLRTSCLVPASSEIDPQLSAPLPAKDVSVCPLVVGGRKSQRWLGSLCRFLFVRLGQNLCPLLHSLWQCGGHLCLGPGNRK